MKLSKVIEIYKDDTAIGFTAKLTNSCNKYNLSEALVVFAMGEHLMNAIPRGNDSYLVAFEKHHVNKLGFFDCRFIVKHSDNRIESYPELDEPRIKIHVRE